MFGETPITLEPYSEGWFNWRRGYNPAELNLSAIRDWIY
jgi:hypothetical protein